MKIIVLCRPRELIYFISQSRWGHHWWHGLTVQLPPSLLVIQWYLQAAPRGPGHSRNPVVGWIGRKHRVVFPPLHLSAYRPFFSLTELCTARLFCQVLMIMQNLCPYRFDVVLFTVTRMSSGGPMACLILFHTILLHRCQHQRTKKAGQSGRKSVKSGS